MIEVNVYATGLDWKDRKSALCKRIDFEGSLKVDCKQIVDTMRCLFGSQCVIIFTFVP